MMIDHSLPDGACGTVRFGVPARSSRCLDRFDPMTAHPPSSHDGEPARRPITRELARHAAQARFDALPPHVRTEASRAFLNWIGCALGGCREEAVAMALEAMDELGGHPQSSVIGHRRRTDMATAALVNCISSSIQAFDDAHLATVTHPSGPVGSAVMAYAEKHPVSGEAFLTAFALGIEVQCRLSNVLVLPPANFNVGFYVTGLSGPIGAAVAVGSLMGLDEQRMNWAIGLAASQSSGFRATHGTMTAHFRPGHAARAGLVSALLAARGFTGDDHSLEADKGFLDVFTAGADLRQAVDGLGERFELLANAYKPYPGIVIHPTLDGCLDVHRRMAPADRPVRVVLRVHPLAVGLTGVREPRTPLESHVSLYHWAAAALLRGRAGLAEMREDCIHDPQVARLRASIEAIPDASVARDQSIVEVTTSSGATLRCAVQQTRGSIERPMTDEELDEKFRSQALEVLPADVVEDLRVRCRGVAGLRDVGKEIAGAWLG